MLQSIIFVLLSLIITLSNIGRRRGGDAEIVFSFNTPLLNYAWLDNGLGTFSGSILRFFSSILDYIFGFIQNYTLKSSIILFLIIFFVLIGYYLFIKQITKNKNWGMIMSFFIVGNFIVWGGIVRQTYFIVFTYLITPYVLYFLEKTRNKKNITAYGFQFIILGFFEGIIANNPGFFISQIGIIIIYILYKSFFYNKLSFKKYFFLFLSLLWGVFSVSISMLILMKNNPAIRSDEWNNIVLLEMPLNRQKQEMNVGKALIGINLDIFDQYGMKNNLPYYPYPNAKILSSTTGQLILRVIVLILIIALISHKKNNIFQNKKFLFWISIFLIVVRIYKSAGYPGGDMFIWFMKNIPGFGIFRNPHQKVGIVYIISIIILLSIYFNALGVKKRYFLSGVITLYTLFTGYPYITGEYITEIMNTKNMPIAYSQISNLINKDNNTYRILSLPFSESTQITTNRGYEGYNPFGLLLQHKSTWNRNDTSFSEYNNIYLTSLRESINKDNDGRITINNDKFINFVNKTNIDTIIVDGYVDNKERFGEYSDINGYLNYLNNLKEFNLKYKIGSIYAYTLKGGRISLLHNLNIVLSKSNPTKYQLTLNNLSGPDSLSFLQSFHPQRKLFPGKLPLSCSSENQQKYNSYERSTGTIANYETYTVQSGESLPQLAKANTTTVQKLKERNPDRNQSGKGRLEVGQELKIKETYTTGQVMKQTGTGNITECIRDNYTFFEGEEISYLRQKPLRDETHQLVNEYANGREINLNDKVPGTEETYLQKGLREGRITQNPDKTYTVNLTLYFRPQSRFYLGLGISGLTFLGLITWLIIDSRKKKK